ncbi:DMT family transporter [Ruegeria sediminis]|uniref:DMT family transporter n=1 Tax=Ruegeria sediminis TaxID=2583820 RepID=A0ABY2WTL4_9RHOB|nr:DMT family transporter [Ruegeria sediminis]TMV04866.1 DMT family transporter [Ruegeria sediminis]
MEDRRTTLAYGALLLAMLISAGNFLFGNLAVNEVPPVVLAFWRSLIAAVCVLPFVIVKRGNPLGCFLGNWLRMTVLATVGVVFTPWLVYLALRSNDLIDLGAGYTSVPLWTILISALLLGERLRPLQYLGVALALVGALVFVFRGSLANLGEFKPHLAFLLMIASNAFRGLYLVLLKKWDLHPKPEEGLFVILVLGCLIMSPFVIAYETGAPKPFDYSWQVWGSILFIGVGMGALYLHLLNFGTAEIGASAASLFSYLVPIFVAVESVLVLGAGLHIYQGVGAVLIIGGVLIATRLHVREAPADHAPH